MTLSNDHVEPIVEVEVVVAVSSSPAALGAGRGIYGSVPDTPPFNAARSRHALVIRWLERLDGN